MAGTLMAVDPNAPKVNRFITLGGEPYLIRYNSRLPIVVYVPEGVEVRYRIWTAAPKPQPWTKAEICTANCLGILNNAPMICVCNRPDWSHL